MANVCGTVGTDADLTASEAVEKIGRGDLTAEALTRACLDRIADIEDQVHAFAYLDPDLAIRNAQAVDKAGKGGVIQGVPFAMKDIIDTADMPTGHGSPIYTGHRVAWDAPSVAACRASGGVALGKTVTTEFAHRHPNETRNPHNTDHTPGGSSSGSAAAVGAHMVPVAFGTQTTGSIIRPAAFCGTVGYKPSYGDFSTTGVRDNVPSFDTLGLIARSVDDLALFRAAVMALPHEQLAAVDVSGLSIGLCRTAFWDKADASTQTLLERTADALGAAGATVTDFSLPDGEATLPDEVINVSGFEFSRVMMHERMQHEDQLSDALLEGRVADGLRCSYAQYRASEAVVRDYRQRAYAAMQEVDLLLTPSAPGEAPDGITKTGDAVFNNIWTTTHLPALTLPAGMGPKGLPLGVQLVGHLHQDHRMLSAAKAVQAAVLL